MQWKRMSLLMIDGDERRLLESIREEFPVTVSASCRAPLGEAPQVYLNLHGLEAPAHLSRSHIRDAGYVIIGARSLVAGQLALQVAKAAPERTATARFWRAVRRATIGGLHQLNPVGNHWYGAATDVRAGIDALAFWQSGGLLGDVNAQVFYGIKETAG